MIQTPVSICFGISQRLYAKFEVLYAFFVWPTF